jgi:hypothetical protein
LLSRKWKKLVGIALLTLLIAVAACTPERDQSELFAPEFLDILVIDAVLIVGQEYPIVILSRTLAPNVPFSQEAAAEVGAVINIANDNIANDLQSMTYRDVPGQPGVYEPVPGYYILSETEYRLTVTTTGGEQLTARTMTPAPFSVDEWVLLDSTGSTELRTLKTFADFRDSVYFQPENQILYAEGLLEARFAPGGAGQFSAAGYQLALFSIDPGSDYVIDPPFFEDEDFEDLPRKGSSPILNIDDGRIRLPWFGIYFEGRHNYKVFVTDQNWYDLVRSTPPSDGGLGFGGNAGDSQDQPIFHVEGGIGLFGSAAVDSVGFYVLPEN